LAFVLLIDFEYSIFAFFYNCSDPSHTQTTNDAIGKYFHL
jgi:hypothetical protein